MYVAFCDIEHDTFNGLCKRVAAIVLHGKICDLPKR